MRRTIVEIMLLSLVAACTAPMPEEAMQRQAATVDGGPACPTTEPDCVAVASPVYDSAACLRGRWIAYISEWNGTCPAVKNATGGTWSGTSLFEAASTDPGWTLAPGLQPFCVYEWQPNPEYTGGPDVATLKDELAPWQATLDRDCRMLVPMASTADDLMWQDLNTHFHEQANHLSPLPLNPAAPPRHVRVAVVDSVPDDYTPANDNTGTSPHGWAVSRSIRELGCPDPENPASACITRLASHLALTIDDTGTLNIANGGYYGRISDAAVAVVHAVNEWRLHNRGKDPDASDYQPRLVVNMSVAWDARWGGAYTGSDSASLPVRARAVHAAITHLKCRGGLAIAAAGNDPGGPEEATGPMLPALWETKPAPDKAACEQFEDITYTKEIAAAVFPPAGIYDPLVHAASGVRADSELIAVTRPGSRAGLAAHASHVVAADEDAAGNPIPTAVLTGSSMAAAVTSAVAGTVWGYRPDLTGAEIMEKIYVAGAGESLGANADFHLEGKAEREIHRVLLCASVAEACPLGKGRCPTSAWKCPARPTARPAAPQDTLDTLATEAEHDQVATPSAAGYDQFLEPVAVCQHEGFHSDDTARYPAITCPYRQWGQVVRKPWSGGQPGSYPCPTCFMVMSSTENGYEADLYLSIEPDFTYDVKAGTIKIDGYPEIDVSALGTLSPGTEARLMDIPIATTDPFFTVEQAVLNMRNVDENGIELDTASANDLIVQ